MLITTEHARARQQLYEQASHVLSQIDADWQQHIMATGNCGLQLTEMQPLYEALIQAIAHQQLHGNAARAILQRFLALYHHQFPTAQQIIASSVDDLRACGFSSQKVDSIRAIASAQQDGIIPELTVANGMPDADLIKCLTLLKGIGRWTVEMLLIHNLGRTDIFPVDDFAVVDGYRRLKKLDQSPTRKQMLIIAEYFAPYRSIAAWYLWQVPKKSLK